MTRRVPELKAGQRIVELRQPLNRVITAFNQSQSGPAGSTGTAPGFAPAGFLLLEIKTLNAANLTCVLPNMGVDPNAQEYTVELPQTFNEAGRGSVTYTYTDINNRTADGTEVQELTPVYLVGDLIVAVLVGGGAFWMDVNADGRQWAKVP